MERLFFSLPRIKYRKHCLRRNAMPIIYLSPSTQDWNLYLNGGTEEYYMNLIADAMVPYLRSCGIQYTRNTPNMTAASSIRASNAGRYDLHLALHSNASPESSAGQNRGSEVYYAAGSRNGKRAAEIIANNLKKIYPYPEKVRALTTNYLGEVTKTRAPAVLIEFAYHDNQEDMDWIVNNIQAIAANVVQSLTEYFGIPFILPQQPVVGVVTTQRTSLNIRSKPSITAPIIGQVGRGYRVTVYGTWEDWYVIDSSGVVGYANSRYITL